MSLHGSLETFALPEVLTLLSSTRKQGELRVVGARTDGRLWFDGGRLVGADTGTSTDPVEAVFDLLRLPEGEFTFEAEVTPPVPGDPLDVDPVLAEAQARLAEWREIEKVVPSLAAAVRLVADAPGEDVSVRAAQWRTIVAVASSTTVQDVMDGLGQGEFPTCKALKELVELGLVEVVADGAQAGAPGEPDVEGLVEIPARARKAKVAPQRQAASEPADDEEAAALVRQLAELAADDDAADGAAAGPAPASAEAGEGDQSDPNRGALLKFLSSVKS